MLNLGDRSFIYSVHQIIWKNGALANRYDRLILIFKEDISSFELLGVSFDYLISIILDLDDLLGLFLVLFVNLILEKNRYGGFFGFESVLHHFGWARFRNLISELFSCGIFSGIVLPKWVTICPILFIHATVLGWATSVLPWVEVVLARKVLGWQKTHGFGQFFLKIVVQNSEWVSKFWLLIPDLPIFVLRTGLPQITYQVSWGEQFQIVMIIVRSNNFLWFEILYDNGGREHLRDAFHGSARLMEPLDRLYHLRGLIGLPGLLIYLAEDACLPKNLLLLIYEMLFPHFPIFDSFLRLSNLEDLIILVISYLLPL